MKTAIVYLPKRKQCESSGSYVKPVKNLFRSLATKNGKHLTVLAVFLFLCCNFTAA